jgi:hypothetical protein
VGAAAVWSLPQHYAGAAGGLHLTSVAYTAAAQVPAITHRSSMIVHSVAGP